MSAPSIQLELGEFFVFLETLGMLKVYRNQQIYSVAKYFALANQLAKELPYCAPLSTYLAYWILGICLCIWRIGRSIHLEVAA
ncbi:MAG: hypothetical protein H7Y37_18355 [Anaerolineae bacterium]|nr:hypothetical protein [Gloeobacterales cyanobacterium ES-bin-313]